TVEALDAGVDGCLVHVVHASEVVQDLAAGQPVVETHATVHDAYARPDLLGLRHDVETRHRGGAGVGLEQRGQHAQGGRLAGAVGPQQTVHLAGHDVEVEVVDGDDLLAALAALERLRQATHLDHGFT